LVRFNGVGDGYKEKVIQVIAGLYAMYPVNCGSGNFGGVCKALMGDDEITKLINGEEGPLSKRFHHLLAADGHEILDRVIRFVMRIKNLPAQPPICYKKLHEDLMDWQTYKKDKVRTEWAKSFWSVYTETEEGEE
jgi:hypothetical protein